MNPSPQLRRLAVVCTAGLSSCATMYSPTEVTVYHGQGNSQAVSYEVGNQTRAATSQREIPLTLPQGTRVCINVLNAHSPGFTYAVHISVDSTPPTPPSFGGLIDLLSSVIPGAAQQTAQTFAGQPARAQAMMNRIAAASGVDTRALTASGSSELETVQSVLNTYRQNIETLSGDLSRAKDAIRQSLFAETLLPGELQVARDEERGLRHAQHVLNGLPSDSGHFNDPHLDQTINAWKDQAMRDLPENMKSDFTAVVNALDQQARTLLATRNAVRDTYQNAPLSWRECHALTNGTSTLTLQARPRTTDEFAGQRDTGTIVTVTAVTTYPRNAVEIVPLAFVAFPHNVTGFGIENNVVVENVKYADNAALRVGTMLTATPLRFGPTAEWAFGPGIGTGILGGGKPALSDFFLGGLLSWRDWLRVGGGYGFSQAPAQLANGAEVGKPLPLGDGRESLSDFIQNKRVGTWFLALTLTGLKLKVPGT